jgi:hypothetical protein
MAKDFDTELFKDHSDYWQIAQNIKDIYLSEGSLLTLLDFERVLDSMDIYAFKNWDIGELIQGPIISKYKVSCVFLWPDNLMPDPRGARRLLPFDCEVKYKKTTMQIPIKIENPDDYRPGTKIARITEKKIWMVQITMPKSLMSDIRTGSIELEDQDIDLSELDNAWDSAAHDAESKPAEADESQDQEMNASPEMTGQNDQPAL